MNKKHGKLDEIGSFYTNQSNSRSSLKAGEIWGKNTQIYTSNYQVLQQPSAIRNGINGVANLLSPAHPGNLGILKWKQFFPSFNMIILAISKIDLSFKKSFKLTKSFNQVYQILIGCRIVLLLLFILLAAAAAAALVDVVDKDEDEDDKDENKLE